MGLSGPRRKRTITRDPNNTHWSRSESKYGQRILQAQGWNPGEYLGAKNAPHSKFHTNANLSHIKVSIREDNLGLGARVGAAGGEWESTGLGGFEDLLGRLNGKSEVELGRARTNRETLKRSVYAERRWGTLRFVSGGLLVGDKIEGPEKEEGEAKSLLMKATPGTNKLISPMMEDNFEDAKDSKRVSKKTPKKPTDLDNLDGKISLKAMPLVENATAMGAAPFLQAVDEDQRKAKAERKRQRRLKREARHETKITALARSGAPLLSAQEPSQDCEVTRGSASLSNPSNGIHAVRHRHIRHKKRAMMDSKALKEILMIKA